MLASFLPVLAKKQTNQSNKSFMLIPNIIIKNPSTFRFENFRTKKDMKSNFSGLI